MPVAAAPTCCAFYLFIRVMEITDILSQNVPLACEIEQFLEEVNAKQQPLLVTVL